MSKVYANEINEKEEEQKLPKKEYKQEGQKQDMKEGSDTAGASGFSDDVEKKFQEKKKGKFAKLHDVIKKGLTPPQAAQTNQKGRWTDLKVRVRWGLIMVSLFFLILFMGHFYSSIMVGLLVIMIFYELIDIPRFKERNAEIKNYYFII